MSHASPRGAIGIDTQLGGRRRGTDRILEIGFGPGVAFEAAARLARRGLVVGLDQSGSSGVAAER